MPAFFSPFRTASAPAWKACFSALSCGAALLLGSAQALAWDIEDVAALARQRAETPFQPAAPAAQAMPAELATLDYDSYRDIRYKPALNLWRADKLPYEINFFHVGRQGEAVRIHEISADGVKPLAYDPATFDFGKNQFQPQAWGDLGHGGVRAFSHLNSPEHKDELIVFSGASYFRALGMGQRYGLSARGLAVDTVGAAQEEFPRFTDFWLVRPAATDSGAGATATAATAAATTAGAGAAANGPLTIYALLDSPRMSGAYRFDVKPGDDTVTEVHAKIFMRAIDKPVATLGLAPLTSMFFFGENQPRPGDFRPEVHDSDGLMIALDDGQGGGEWLWRPLQNPSSTLVTSFAVKRLKGFGLMQRDRAFASYEDTEARYELRPSAWITPLSGFGAGRVELLQFATPDETHDNVAAYWVPEKMPAPGAALELRYQIAWQGQNQQRPPNSWVTQSRKGTGYSQLGAEALARQTQFVIDFTGPALDALPEGAQVQAITTASANARILESQAWRNPATGTWRMALRVERLPVAQQPAPTTAQPGQTPEATQPLQPIELRAFLQDNHHTLSETWTNLITN
ncbi:MAG: glucan biosynthesis protein G [Polaromonas sp.]|nr:glucan biosynthesis protein G [Polaromonas sp.]